MQRRSCRLLLCCAAFWCLSISTAEVHAERATLFDFDTAKKLSVDWSAVGEINVSRKAAPKAEVKAENAPAGNGIFVQTKGKAGVFAKSGRAPGDWRSFRTLSFWIHRDEAEAKRQPKATLEVQLYETNGQARFWRRVEVTHSGWKQFTLPLRWFRWGGQGRVPRWERIDRFGFWFRDSSDLWIDEITVERGDAAAAEFTATELRAVAFPGIKESEVRSARNESVVILSDARQLDIEKLANHFKKVDAALRADLQIKDPPSRVPIYLVFATRERYRAFTPRFAQQFNSYATEPKSSGYTLHGVATSFWNEEYGSLRPVYTHEYIHTLLSRSFRLPSRGDWLHEGLASMYQLRYHTQANFSKIVIDGIVKDDFHAPLKELCNGKSIPMNRYWQALTVVETLMTDEAYKQRFPALVQAVRVRGDANLENYLQPILNTDWDSLTAAWKKHCRAKYRAN